MAKWPGRSISSSMQVAEDIAPTGMTTRKPIRQLNTGGKLRSNMTVGATGAWDRRRPAYHRHTRIAVRGSSSHVVSQRGGILGSGYSGATPKVFLAPVGRVNSRSATTGGGGVAPLGGYRIHNMKPPNKIKECRERGSAGAERMI
jgi:hypothetical protein